MIILVILLIAQAINWFFNINVPENVRPPPLEVHTPLFILLIISFVMIVYVYYFYKFMIQLTEYKNLLKVKDGTLGVQNESQVSQGRNLSESTESSTSLTKTMYSLNDMVERLKLLFAIVLILSFFYILWFFQFFIQDLTIIQIFTFQTPPPPPGGPFMPPPPPFNRLFNYITVIALVLFFIINLRYYYKWHEKTSKLKELEIEIYNELNLDD